MVANPEETSEMCQGRMKIPQIAGRKFPTPHQVVVDANRHFSEHG
jgi:hypothetical protein